MFRNEEIYTICISDSNGFSLLNHKIGPFKKGKTYKLKFFIALPFIEKNILKLTPREKCDSLDVQRYAVSERDDQKLVKRADHYFLNKIKEFKVFMEKKVKDQEKPKIDLDRYNSYMSNIIYNRLLKLLKLATTEPSFKDEEKLTFSEKILFKRLNKLLSIWNEFF